MARASPTRAWAGRPPWRSSRSWPARSGAGAPASQSLERDHMDPVPGPDLQEVARLRAQQHVVAVYPRLGPDAAETDLPLRSERSDEFFLIIAGKILVGDPHPAVMVDRRDVPDLRLE